LLRYAVVERRKGRPWLWKEWGSVNYPTALLYSCTLVHLNVFCYFSLSLASDETFGLQCLGSAASRPAYCKPHINEILFV
jgi:hypothetical protein